MTPAEFVATIGDWVAAQSNSNHLIMPMNIVKELIDSVQV